MKIKFTRTIAFLVCLAGASWMLPLVAQTDEQIERFNKEREVYYNENLQLTDSEIKAFWPLYNDFNNRKMKLMEDERSTFVYAQKNANNLSDKEITESLDKIRKLKEDQLRLETEYYQIKFPKVLPPKKVLNLYKVEWDFRRHLLRKLREQGREGRTEDAGAGGGNGPHPLPHEPMF